MIYDTPHRRHQLRKSGLLAQTDSRLSLRPLDAPVDDDEGQRLRISSWVGDHKRILIASFEYSLLIDAPYFPSSNPKLDARDWIYWVVENIPPLLYPRQPKACQLKSISRSMYVGFQQYTAFFFLSFHLCFSAMLTRASQIYTELVGLS